MGQLAAVVGPQRAAQLEQTLRDPRAGTPRITNNVRAQAILDQIGSVRERQADSAWAATRNAPKPVHVLVALVDRLPDSSSVALVVRRPTSSPVDVIVLSNATASPQALGAAMHALVQLREREAGLPVRPVQLRVHDAVAPESWAQDGLSAQAAADLTALTRAPIVDVPGVGRARTKELVVLSR
jgi:hypothetical protein